MARKTFEDLVAEAAEEERAAKAETSTETQNTPPEDWSHEAPADWSKPGDKA